MAKSYKASCVKENFTYMNRTPNGNYVIRWNPQEYTEGEGESAITMLVYNETVVNAKPTYASVVSLLIREEYTMDDELALNRQKEEKPQEWQTYYDYCESCKMEGKRIMGIEE